MRDNNEIKDKEIVTDEIKPSLAPEVNEKLKYYLIAFMFLLCVVTALLVIFSPEARQLREERSAQSTCIYKGEINT